MTTSEIIDILKLKIDDCYELFNKAHKIKEKFMKNKVYLRGLIEYSNICQKNCYYCGLRKDNNKIERYTMTDEEVVEAAVFAYKNKLASIVIQSGEIQSNSRKKEITYLLNKINKSTNNELGITLSLGEQNKETLKEWKNSGAIRYLLRIETSNPNLYSKLHPNNDYAHSFNKRLEVLYELKELDYQVGTGIMIGLPSQTLNDLANDIHFFVDNDIDMLGMGPYIEHSNTPLYNEKDILPVLSERLNLTLKMIAIVRIIMKNINIVATTALQTIDENSREKAILAGANVIMPNISPIKYRNDYSLYENKICHEEASVQSVNYIFNQIKKTGAIVGLNEQGNSLHYIYSHK